MKYAATHESPLEAHSDSPAIPLQPPRSFMTEKHDPSSSPLDLDNVPSHPGTPLEPDRAPDTLHRTDPPHPHPPRGHDHLLSASRSFTLAASRSSLTPLIHPQCSSNAHSLPTTRACTPRTASQMSSTATASVAASSSGCSRRPKPCTVRRFFGLQHTRRRCADSARTLQPKCAATRGPSFAWIDLLSPRSRSLPRFAPCATAPTSTPLRPATNSPPPSSRRSTTRRCSSTRPRSTSTATSSASTSTRSCPPSRAPSPTAWARRTTTATMAAGAPATSSASRPSRAASTAVRPRARFPSCIAR